MNEPLKTQVRRPRKVFGRIFREFGGKTYRFEQRADAIYMRAKHSRKLFRLSYADAWEAAQGQLPLL